MKSSNILIRTAILLSLVCGALTVKPQTASAATPEMAANSKGVSPASHLNPDGTLKLDDNFSGSFDITNWDVQIDPARGPVFSPVAAQDNWEALGSAGAFNFEVYSIVASGSDIYVGGAFSDLDSIPEADYVARWDGTQWHALSSNGSGDGALSGNQVNAMAFINGELYVGGTYLTINSIGNIFVAGNLAKWNGSAWSAVGSLTTLTGGNSVQEIAFYNGPTTNDFLYVGGEFTDLGGNLEADYIARYSFNTSAWLNMDNNGAGVGSLTNIVYGLAVDSLTGFVYVGGAFTDADGIAAADKIAKWDGTAWSALGASSAIVNGYVFSILVNSSTEIFVGGSFTDVDGLPAADYIAKWNGTAWSALGSYSANGALSNIGNTVVRTMFVDSGTLYVGGAFNMSDPSLAAGKLLAKYAISGGTWSIVDDNGSDSSPLITNAGSSILSLAISGGELYLGSYDVSGIDDNGTILSKASDFTSMNISTHAWSTYGTDNGVFQISPVRAVAAIGTDVFVGGNFQNANRDSRMDYLIRWDGSAWNPVGGLTQGSLNNQVFALAADGTDLYVGGLFNSASEADVLIPGTSRIAKWDTLTETWSALGSGISSGSVSALAVDASHTVYAGGSFTNAGAIPEADYIAKWNGSAWSALAGNGAGDGALNATVYAIAVNSSRLYIGGLFTSVKDTSNTAIPNAAYLAQWSGTTWSAMPGTTTAFDGSIQALAYAGGNLYVGGSFSNANNISGTSSIAKWNSSTLIWSAMGNDPVNAAVYAIAVDGTDVYIGGPFTNVANGVTPIPTADYIAKWNGSTWSALGSNGAGNGSLNSAVFALTIIQNDLWVGGDFLNVNNNGSVLKAADKLAVYGLDIPPTVSSSTRASANPTGAASVNFTVTFSETVTGVNASDFVLTGSGVSSAAVSGVSGLGSSYTVTVNTGTGSGTLRLDVVNDNSITDAALNSLAAGFTSGESYTINKSPVFDDVPYSYWANSYIERLYKAGITGGCTTTPLNYCPDNSVTRAQMAIFLLKGMHGSSFTPPAVGLSTGFTDVALDYWAAAWIKQLAAEGITGGCGPGIYCPDATVTRAQMAVFLLKAKHGSSYTPPTATGVFTDVPLGYWADKWIEQLAVEGVTSGCGTGIYCPDADVTRAQMAVFLVKNFSLP